MKEIDTGIMAGTRKVTMCFSDEPLSERELVDIGHEILVLMGIEERKTGA